MIVKPEETERIIQYLFNELSESERDSLEERIFSDEDFSLFLEATEKDLVDDYVLGEMDSDLCQRFEKKYLTSESRHEKVRIANILQKEVFVEKGVVTPIVTESKASLWEVLSGFFKIPNLVWAGGLAAILLGILLIGLILSRQSNKDDNYVKDNNLNRQIPLPTPQISPQVSPTTQANIQTNETPKQVVNTNRSEVQNQEKKPTPIISPTSKPTPKGEEVKPLPEQRIFVATLLPALRSDEKKTLNIPKNSKIVQLKIVHDNQKPFAQYHLEIRNQDGNLILKSVVPVNEKTLRSPITLTLQSYLLKPGSYEMTLSGIDKEKSSEEIKFYNFVINRKR